MRRLIADVFLEVLEKADRHNMVLIFSRKTGGELAGQKCKCFLEDFVTKEHAVEMMVAIGDALSQDPSIQPYAMHSKLVDAYWEKYSEAESLLQRRKDLMICDESKGTLPHDRETASGGTPRWLRSRMPPRL